MAPASACLLAAVKAKVPAVQQSRVTKAAIKPVFILAQYKIISTVGHFHVGKPFVVQGLLHGC